MSEEQERAAIREQGEVGAIATIRSALGRVIEDYDRGGINEGTTRHVHEALTASNVLVLLRAHDEAVAALSQPASPGATDATQLPMVTWKTGETRRLTLQEAACLFPDSGWAKEARIAPLTPPANPATEAPTDEQLIGLAEKHHVWSKYGLEDAPKMLSFCRDVLALSHPNPASNDESISDYAAEIMQWAHIFMVKPEIPSNYDEIEARLKAFVARTGSVCVLNPATFWAEWNETAGPLPDLMDPQ